jgi:glycerol-3-phosphate dehydrogenase subunit C
VDVGRLLQEHKARYRAANGATIMQRTLEYSDLLSSAQSFAAPVVNALVSWKPARLLMEYTLGIDHRRPLPKAASVRAFRKLNRTREVRQPKDKVVLFHDLFARYNRPELTALAIGILEYFQIQVVSVPLGSAGMPAIVYGHLKLAGRTIAKSKTILAEYINKGYKIVSTEPTAVLALRKEWKDVDSSAEVQAVSTHTFEFFEFLNTFLQRNKIKPDFAQVHIQLGYHAPCHLKALQVGRPGVELLRRIPGVEIHEIDRGCCGIAGTYGFKKGKHGYDVSMQIGKDLFEELKQPRHNKGLSECSTCRMQMEHGSGKEVLHPIEILAQALNIRESYDE